MGYTVYPFPLVTRTFDVEPGISGAQLIGVVQASAALSHRLVFMEAQIEGKHQYLLGTGDLLITPTVPATFDADTIILPYIDPNVMYRRLSVRYYRPLEGFPRGFGSIVPPWA